MSLTDEENELIDKNTERIEDIPNQFINDTKKVEKDSFNRAVALIDNLEFDNDGRLKVAGNIEQTAAISSQIQDYLLESDFQKSFRNYLSEFDKQAENANQIMQKTLDRPDLEISDEAKAMLTSQKQRTAEIFLRAGLQESVTKPIRDTLDQLVGQQATKENVVSALNTIMVTDDERNSKLLLHTKRNATDRFAFADRAFTAVQAADNEWYVYRGGTVRDSRDFCIKRNGEFFHINEVREWGNLSRWDGMIPGTNSGNIRVLLGGYNCMHSLMPVSVFRVPLDVLQRNIDDGNFSPDENLRQQLGI